MLSNPVYKNFSIQILVICISFILVSSNKCFTDNLNDSLIKQIEITRNDTVKIILLLELSNNLKEKHPDSSLIFIKDAEEILANHQNQINGKRNWLNQLIYKKRNAGANRRVTKLESSILRQKAEVLFFKKEIEAAINLLNLSLIKSSEINDIKGCSITFIEIGKIYLAIKEYEKAKTNFEVVLNLSSRSNFKDCLHDALCNLGQLALITNQPDSSITFYNRALEIAKEIGDQNLISETLLNNGLIFKSLGKNTEALEYFRQAIATSQGVKNSYTEANSLFNIGLIYSNQGRFAEAIDVFLRSTKILELHSNSENLPSCYINLGMVYSEKGDYSKSLTYILKALEINQRNNNQEGIATAYLYLGSNYSELNRTDDALNAYLKGIKYQKNTNDKVGLVKSYIGLGELYQQTGDYKLSNYYYQKSLVLITEINDPWLTTKAHISYSQLLLKTGNFEKAQVEANLALNSAKKTSDTPLLLNSIALIAETYEKNGNYKAAYLHQLLGYKLLDSISKKSKSEIIANVEATYITELNKHELESLNKTKELQALKIKENIATVKKQRILNYFYLVGFIFVFGFGYVFFRQAQRKKVINELLESQNKDIQLKTEEIITQRDEIEAQRDEIEAQRNDITRQKEEIEKIFQIQTDSILYARQIQNAILPDTYVFTDNLPNSFIFYRPKDIVSGDFYWVSPIGDKIGFTVVDCTGHGVAGAMLSMLGSSLLNELTAKPEDVDPGELLTELRSYIIMSLWQKGFIGEQVVGMDLAFCIYDPNTLILRYAGANNPVYIFTKDDTGAYALVELKPDKMPISMSIRMNTFSTQTFQLKKGDTIYLFSDGFSDQLGGPINKKYSIKNFKIFLSSIVEFPMEEQKRLLAEEFENWKGKNQQIDDLTIMGIRV